MREPTLGRSCRSKRRYKTMGIAMAAIRYYERMRSVSGLRAYFCGFCHRYHVGHRGESQWERENHATSKDA